MLYTSYQNCYLTNYKLLSTNIKKKEHFINFKLRSKAKIHFQVWFIAKVIKQYSMRSIFIDILQKRSKEFLETFDNRIFAFSTQQVTNGKGFFCEKMKSQVGAKRPNELDSLEI